MSQTEKRISFSRRDFIIATGTVAAGTLCGRFLLGGRNRVDTPVKPAVPRLSSLAIGPGDTLYVGGEFGVRGLNPQGTVIQHWPLPFVPHDLSVDEQGRVFAAGAQSVAECIPGQDEYTFWQSQAEAGARYLTGIKVSGGNVFLADAGKRVVERYSREGRLLNTIGMAARDNTGFVLPSPFFDLDVHDGVLHVNNFGRFRIEQYDYEGNLLGFWGHHGLEPDAFPGCCNPTHLSLLGDGRTVVSQKGDPCIKVFAADGSLLQHLGQDIFADPVSGTFKNPDPLNDCTTPGIAVAADSRGRIFALDPIVNGIRVFGEGRSGTLITSSIQAAMT